MTLQLSLCWGFLSLPGTMEVVLCERHYLLVRRGSAPHLCISHQLSGTPAPARCQSGQITNLLLQWPAPMPQRFGGVIDQAELMGMNCQFQAGAPFLAHYKRFHPGLEVFVPLGGPLQAVSQQVAALSRGIRRLLQLCCPGCLGGSQRFCLLQSLHPDSDSSVVLRREWLGVREG